MLPAIRLRGFSLVEVMIGMFLSTLLISGIVSLIGSSLSAYRLQLSQGQLQESGRYARDVLVSHITPAGYQPRPWQDPAGFAALTGESVNNAVARGDQLGLQRWSQRNCYGNENPVTDGEGRPEFYLLQARFFVNADNNLAINCRYGPDATGLLTQINSFGLVENVESMQVLYAEDRNGDEIADGWVQAQAWNQEADIRAVKVALLLATPDAFGRPVSEHFTLLDETMITAADGHLREVSSLTAAIRGRLK